MQNQDAQSRERASKCRPDPDRPPTRPPAQPSQSHRSSLNMPLFEQRLLNAAIDQERTAPLFDGNRREPRLRLRILQYMNIIYQKKKLTAEIALMRDRATTDEDQMQDVKYLMRDYVQTIRDLQYMLEPPSRFSRTSRFLRDLFYIEKDCDSAVLQSGGFLPRRLIDDDSFWVFIPEYAGYGGFSQMHDDEKERMRAYLGRLWFAILSGLSLIGPMLLMKLVGGLLVQLVTASACVLILGGILAFSEEMQKKDVVAVTAAYAAVLVVFIGSRAD